MRENIILKHYYIIMLRLSFVIGKVIIWREYTLKYNNNTTEFGFTALF